MRGDSFIGQQPAGIRWLHVHPMYVVTTESWAVIRLAHNWRDGVLPEAGGVQDQAAWTVAAVDIVLGAWGRMRAAEDKKRKS